MVPSTYPTLLVAALWLVVGLGIGCGEVEDLAGREGGVHPAGFATADGHARALRANGDNVGECYACHRLDEGPGACTECHTEGPEDCAVCHGAPDAPHTTHGDFECATCHAVPAALGSPGHLVDRGDADVRLLGGGRYTAGRCADTPCHAGPGADAPTPEWGERLGGPRCAACHGAPPPDHPGGSCDGCHVGANADGTQVDAVTHLNGRVEALDWRALGCDGCHGSEGSPAPPRSLDGGSDRGAHVAHLQPIDAAAVDCATCHLVPVANDAPGHLDDGDGRAEVIFGPAAGVAPTYSRGGCADTTCHGPDRPAWTGTAPCGSCHGLPPPDHAAGDCARCHLTASPGGGIAVPADHVDGRVDVEALTTADCARCHVDGPVVPGGSHPAHARFDCAHCHAPTDDVPAHLDGSAPVVLRTGRFVAGGCSDTDCHGVGTPSWGEPGSVAGCDACHGAPPDPHPVGECSACHPSSDAVTHVDGRVDVAFRSGCGDCHGAPPDTGAHRAHAAPSQAAPVACEACHAVPSDVAAVGHIDPAPAEVVLAIGVYDGVRCSDAPCHAGPGAVNPAPAWDGPAARCGDCHGVPPPRHLRGACGQCHRGVAEGYDIVDPARHVDGQVDFR